MNKYERLLKTLDKNGLEDALWDLRAHKGIARIFACDCAERVLDKAGKYRTLCADAIQAAKDVPEKAMQAARDSLWAAAKEAGETESWAILAAAAAVAGSPDSASWYALEAVGVAAWTAAMEAAGGVETEDTWAAARKAAWKAREAERAWQEQHLRAMLTNQKTKKRVRQVLTLRRGQHLVDFHDGKKTHRDGSPFYDTVIFRNAREAERFRKRLISEGYEPVE